MNTGQYLLTCTYNVITLAVWSINEKAPAPIGVEAEAATPRESLRIEPSTQKRINVGQSKETTMNTLSAEKQTRIIGALCEGCSIRATERMTDTHRDTVMNYSVRVGQGCERLHDRMMRDLQVATIELDEQWDFIAKKAKRVQTGDPAEYGDVWLFVALAANQKAILSYVVGKRTARKHGSARVRFARPDFESPADHVRRLFAIRERHRSGFRYWRRFRRADKEVRGRLKSARCGASLLARPRRRKSNGL